MVVIAGCAGGIDNGEPATSGVTEQATTTVATTETAAPTGELVVHQLNVGQGSSTLVVGPDGRHSSSTLVIGPMMART